MDEPSPERYADAVRAYLSESQRLVDHLSEFQWKEGDGFFEVVLRAMLRRQHDALGAILLLCEAERGDCAVPLLRPACEEYIVARYLRQLSRADAERLLVAVGSVESEDDLDAQRKFAGLDVMLDIGFSARFQAGWTRNADVARRELLDLGRELGWPHRKRGSLPPVRFLAQRADAEAVYNFLYHATSRFVHFKTKELMRRAWLTGRHM